MARLHALQPLVEQHERRAHVWWAGIVGQRDAPVARRARQGQRRHQLHGVAGQLHGRGLVGDRQVALGGLQQGLAQLTEAEHLRCLR